jgi:TM2 domain-containing membrane protein YozV
MSLLILVEHELNEGVYSGLLRLPERKQKEFLYQFNGQKLNIMMAIISWWFGLHYLYLGKRGTFILYFCTLGGLGIWHMYDLFRMNQLVKDENDKVALRITTGRTPTNYQLKRS